MLLKFALWAHKPFMKLVDVKPFDHMVAKVFFLFHFNLYELNLSLLWQIMFIIIFWCCAGQDIPWKLAILWQQMWGWFNMNMPLYEYRNCDCVDKIILRPFHLHHGSSNTGKKNHICNGSAPSSPNVIGCLGHIGCYRLREKIPNTHDTSVWINNRTGFYIICQQKVIQTCPQPWIYHVNWHLTSYWRRPFLVLADITIFNLTIFIIYIYIEVWLSNFSYNLKNHWVNEYLAFQLYIQVFW